MESRRHIKWRFLPPYASNFAGVHEVMIRAMKRALRHILVDASVSDEELTTALTRAESLLNSRPITACEDEVSSDLALTSNHFLFGQADPGNLLTGECDQSDGLSPSRRWKLSKA